MSTALFAAISTFGASAKAAFNNPAIVGEPEEQLRTPINTLVRALAPLTRVAGSNVHLVGETKLADLMVRPDFAVARSSALIGFIEIKAPGKGADPTRFKGHDKTQ